jgi:glycosyltransferase involved in cell wall biosynthesis
MHEQPRAGSVTVSVTEGEDDYVIIKHRYLAVQNIPYFVDGTGRVLLERSWHHDLVQHLEYLPEFTLIAPCQSLPADHPDLLPLDEKLQTGLTLIPLPSQTSRIRALVELPRTFWALWSAIGKADIVHSGIAGWPYPLGWLANLIARLRGKKRLIIVESAPWRTAAVAADSHLSLRTRIENFFYERLAGYWCSSADLSFYTQPTYLKQFHGNGKGPAYVTPAIWVNSEDVLNDQEAQSLWEAKVLEPVRFLFAGRLVPEKGVKILLEAVEKLAAAGRRGEIHVIGEGPLRDEVIAAERPASFVLKYFEVLPYGPPFLTFLERYHAVVVPSVSDEQPRIVFDAAARAVPILGSDTNGLRPFVDNDRTGRLIIPGDSQALAEAMALWTENAATLRDFGMAALSRVRGKTHRAMHSERSRIIARHLNVG